MHSKAPDTLIALVPEAAQPAQAAKVEMVTLSDHPVYGKYFKMLRVGLPPPAVMQKCIKDGVDPSVMEKDPATPWPVEVAAVAATPAKPAQAVSNKPKERKKRLHWSGLDAEKVSEGSIWADADDDDDDLEIDEDEFRALFVEQQSKTPKAGGKKAKSAFDGGVGGVGGADGGPPMGTGRSSKAPANLIDGKRAQNGGISLTKVPDAPPLAPFLNIRDPHLPKLTHEHTNIHYLTPDTPPHVLSRCSMCMGHWVWRVLSRAWMKVVWRWSSLRR